MTGTVGFADLALIREELPGIDRNFAAALCQMTALAAVSPKLPEDEKNPHRLTARNISPADRASGLGSKGSSEAVAIPRALLPVRYDWVHPDQRQEGDQATAALVAATRDSLPRTDFDTKPVPLPPCPPLRPWSRTWPFLRRALGRWRAGRRVQVKKLLGSLSRGEPIRRIPYRLNLHWAPQATVVLDWRTEIAFLREDMLRVREHLWRLRGRYGLRLYYEEYSAAAPVGQVGRGPVLVVGDLGQLASESWRIHRWAAWGRSLAARRLARTALVPCPPDRWLEVTSSVWKSAYWDRGGGMLRARRPSILTPAENRARQEAVVTLLAQLAFAYRVEPGLLRSLRLALPQDSANVSTEYAVWHHADAERNDVVMSLIPGVARRLREEAAGQTSLDLLNVFRLLHHWHRHFSAPVRAREVLNFGTIPSVVVKSEPALVEAAEVIRRAANTYVEMGLGSNSPPATAERRRRAEAEGFYAFSLRELEHTSPAVRETLRAELSRTYAMRLLFEGPLAGKPIPVPDDLDDAEIQRTLRGLVGGSSAEQLWELRVEGGNLVVVPWSTPADRSFALDYKWTHLPLAVVKSRSGRFKFTFCFGDGVSRAWWLNGPGCLRHEVWADCTRLKVSSDCGALELVPGDRPAWARIWGQDAFGTYAEFSVGEAVFRMRWIPPGEFWMGSPEAEKGRSGNEQIHRVLIRRGFWLGETPVTQLQYAALMGKNPSRFNEGPDAPERPVESVSWQEAIEYCHRLSERTRVPGFRLPTEAEWEFACRAGTQSAFNDGSASTVPDGQDMALERLGWYDANSGAKTHAVGALGRNAWGLWDMHGNVWEWCADKLRAFDSQPREDPIGVEDLRARRVVRGGCFWRHARLCRSAYRSADVPMDRDGYLGFRLAAGFQTSEVSGASGVEARGAGAPGRP